jgi:hypothetical protein
VDKLNGYSLGMNGEVKTCLLGKWKAMSRSFVEGDLK